MARWGMLKAPPFLFQMFEMRHALLFLCLLLSGYGGTMGNIERYEYACSKPILDRYV